MSKPVFSDKAIGYYRKLVGCIIDGEQEERDRLYEVARLAIFTARKEMPRADTETLVSFFTSIAYLMAHIMSSQVQDVATMLRNTFNSYTIAAAHLMEAIDMEDDTVPARQEPDKGQDAEDSRDTGMYL